MDFVDVYYFWNNATESGNKPDQSISSMTIGGTTLGITKPTDSTTGWMNISLGGTLGPIKNSTYENVTIRIYFLRNPESAGTKTWTIIASDGMGTTYTDSTSITITAAPTPAPTQSDGDGGGGDGGSSGTDEPYENIFRRPVTYITANSGSHVDVNITKDETIVVRVFFDSLGTGGDIPVIVEELVGTSKLVSGPAPGDVYRNFNLYVLMPRRELDIKDPGVVLRIKNSWIREKGFANNEIVLYRFKSDTSWKAIALTAIGSDTNYTYFQGSLPGFGSFAASGIRAQATPTPTQTAELTPTIPGPTPTTTGAVPTPTPTPPSFEALISSTLGIPVWLLLLLAAALLIIILVVTRDYLKKK
ncbi:MAG TPA: PGF-pre-PGF domain-containing protein [Candidatus Methanoperedenaceae archaeon]|nr:PGF-pre-PGF domain-containing protein [Candidatus Methanoperedenaceae archaeon]